VVDRNGIPLAIKRSAANVNDGQMLEATVDAIAPFRQRRGGRRRRPDTLHADKAHDSHRCRHALRSRRITPRIARKGVERRERLGRHRWVVERTLAGLNRFRRLTIRYERGAELHQAFLDLGCALICWNFLQHQFC
jgi:IS5 family transposase